MPSADAGTSSTTFQFRFLPALHHVRLRRRVFYAGCDGGIGYGFRQVRDQNIYLLIVYPLFIRRSARH